jgi:hypothetical protein
VQPAVDDHRRADPLADPEHGEVLRRMRPVPRRGAEGLLGDRGQVHVVLDLDRRVGLAGTGQRAVEPLEQVRLVPAGQVAGVAQPPGARVGRAADADHHAVRPRAPHPGRRPGRGQRLAHPADRPDRRIPPRRGQFGLRDRPPGQVADLGGDRRRSHMQTRDIGRIRAHTVLSCRTPVPGQRLDQPGVFQTVHQLRGGGLRQAGQRAEPGPGQRTLLAEQLQRRTVVDRPQQAGRARQLLHQPAPPNKESFLT